MTIMKFFYQTNYDKLIPIIKEAGTYDGYYEINLKAWDIAAGIIILQEAGGVVTNLENKTYYMFGNEPMVRSNSFIHNELFSYLSWVFLAKLL